MSSVTEKEIRTTQRWGIGIILSIFVATSAFFVRLGTVENKVEQNREDIEQNERRIDNIYTDIRNILIGIEQLKARLGVVENE